MLLYACDFLIDVVFLLFLAANELMFKCLHKFTRRLYLIALLQVQE